MTINFGKIVQRVFLLSITLSVIWTAESEAQNSQWKNPFESVFESVSDSTDVSMDSLTLQGALRLIRDANPSLQASRKRITAAEGLEVQAGLYPNPALEIEVEGVSGNAAGFNESEVNIFLSQELELWGKRGARKRLASSETKSVRLDALFTNFDVYALAVERYCSVDHAQNRVTLSKEATRISESLAETAKSRVDKGASLPSEYILGLLEFERAQLSVEEAESELITAKERLSSLWNEPRSDFSVKQSNTYLETLTDIKELDSLIDNSRNVSAIDGEKRIVNARLKFEESKGKPNVTLTGGLKRFEADDANTFIVGVALPLPFFNRNQGSTASLRASVEALKLEREQAITDAKTTFSSMQRNLSQLTSRYRALSASLLPKAEETYSSLKKAYESGRISYSILLESQRTLINLRFELNDLRLSINRQIITLERLLGVQLH